MNVEVKRVTDCETATLYAALVNPAVRKQIRGVLGINGGRFFSSALYREIYNGLVERSPDIELWDAEALDWMARRNGGDVSDKERMEILNIYSNNSTTATAPYYAERVVECGKQRLAAEIGAKIVQAQHKTPSELMEMLERAAKDIAPQRVQPPEAIRDILPSVMAEIQAGPVKSVYTGFQALDDLLGGLAPANLLVIGGGTGRGKTALALSPSCRTRSRQHGGEDCRRPS